MKPGHWYPLQEGLIAKEKSMKSQGNRNFIVCYPFPVKSKSPRSNFIIFFLKSEFKKSKTVNPNDKIFSFWLSIFKQWDFMVFISKSCKKLLVDVFKCWQCVYSVAPPFSPHLGLRMSQTILPEGFITHLWTVIEQSSLKIILCVIDCRHLYHLCRPQKLYLCWCQTAHTENYVTFMLLEFLNGKCLFYSIIYAYVIQMKSINSISKSNIK